MPVSDYHKCIFVHIPKCAGSSIEDALSIKRRNKKQLHGPDGKGDFLQHMTIFQINKYLNETQQKYFSFVVVRNPYSKLVSDWSWCKRWFKHKWLTTIDDKNVGFPSFESYIIFIEKVGTNAWSHFKLQKDFIYDQQNNLQVDCVCKIETLNISFENIKLCITNGESIKLIKSNVSRHKHWKSYYTEDLYTRVNEIYKKDFEVLNYNFINL